MRSKKIIILIAAVALIIASVVVGIVISGRSGRTDDKDTVKRSRKEAEQESDERPDFSGILGKKDKDEKKPDEENVKDAESSEDMEASPEDTGSEDDKEDAEKEDVIEVEAKRADDFIKDEEYYVFGHYEQDGDESNGPEPIEWVILDENENGTLLLSRYALDCVKYNTKSYSVTWETCSLRDWMNNDFYNTAFSDEEKSVINSVNLVNEDNQSYGTEGGNDTNDRIFALSVSEIFKYFSSNNGYSDQWSYFNSESLITPATVYAQNMGVYTHTITRDDYYTYLKTKNFSENCIGSTGCCWWLRSPASSGRSVCTVNCDGFADADYVNSSTVPVFDVEPDRVYGYGVRPALYINR